MARSVTCEICGKVFETTHGRKVTCSEECKRERYKRRAKIRRQERKENPDDVHEEFRNKSTKCWQCAKSANGGCSWSKSFTPVKGWVAEKKTSYHVKECPEFVREARKEQYDS